MILVLLVFDPLAGDAFSLPKVAIGRSTDILLAAVLICLTIRHGLGVWRWSPLFPAAAVLLVLLGASTALAVDRTLALNGASTRLLGLVTWIDLAFVLVATAALVRTREHARWLALAVIASDLLFLMYLAIQSAGLDPLRWGPERVTSTLGNRTHVGAFAAIVSTLCAAIVATGRSALPLRHVVALSAVALANIIAIGLLGERAPVLALFAGLATIPLIVLARGRDLRLVLGTTGLAIVLAAGLVLAFGDIRSRFETLVLRGEPDRVIIWSATLQAIAERPLFGAGPDNFAAIFPPRRPAESVALLGPLSTHSSTHDLPLQMALAAGVPGLAAFVALLLVAATSTVRLIRDHVAVASAIAAGSASFLTMSLFVPDHYALEVLLWCALGVVAGLDAADPQRAQESRRVLTQVKLRASRSLVAATFAVASVASLTPWPSIQASERYQAARGLENAGRHLEALGMARSAVDQDGGRAEYWAMLGQAQLAVSDPRSALGSFQRAAFLAPYQSGYWRDISSTYLRVGQARNDRANAIEAARRAIVAQPVDAFAHATLAYALVVDGQRDAAVEEAQHAIALWPATPDAYEVLAVAYGQEGRWTDVESAARTGLTYEDSVRFHVLLARVYVATGRRDHANLELDTIQQLDPRNAEAAQLRALLQGQ